MKKCDSRAERIATFCDKTFCLLEFFGTFLESRKGLSLNYRLLKTLLVSLLAVRFGVLLGRAFLPLTLPEIWRQIDTLGVAYRYWMRWTLEPLHWSSLLPAVLNSGDSAGYQAMEFPLLNAVAAPLFWRDVWTGVLFSQWLLCFLTLGLIAANLRAWKGQRILTWPADLVALCCPVISLGGIWVGKFMPDVLAFLLIFWALGASWQTRRAGSSFFLASTGLLMKPTAGLALAILWLRPGTWREKVRHAPWAGAAVGVGLLYYTLGIQALKTWQVGPGRFAVTPSSIFENAAVWARSFDRVGDLFFKQLFFPGALLLFALAYGLKAQGLRRRAFPARLWAILFGQVAIGGLASGEQGLTHPYYFMGVVPVAALLFLDAWDRGEGRAWLRALFALCLTGFILERCNLELRPLFTKQKEAPVFLAEQCRRLRAEHPEFPWQKNKVFRSSVENFPELGLCFGEREGSDTAEVGFFWKRDPLPPFCHSVGESENIRLARCERG